MSVEKICTSCYYKGKALVPGYFIIELILWFCFLLPGLIYSIWRVSKRGTKCPECKNISMISLSTPRGKQLLKEVSEI